MACILIRKAGGTPSIQAQFPIEVFRPVEKNEVQRYQRRVHGMAADAAAAIERLQPYQAGEHRNRHWLALLKRLNNIDKHSALVLHAVRVRPGVNLVLGAANHSKPEGDLLPH